MKPLPHILLILTVLLALTAANGRAETLLFEDFEYDLSAWIGQYGVADHNGVIVDDPLQGSINGALAFDNVAGGGDLFSLAGLTLYNPSGQYILAFDYLGDPTLGGLADDLGGFIGYSTNDYAGTNYWLAGTKEDYATSASAFQHLIDDGSWQHYIIPFTAPAAITLMIEDFAGSGPPSGWAIPGDALFDNVLLTDASGPSPVPEPSTLLLMLCGMIGFYAACKARPRAEEG